MRLKLLLAVVFFVLTRTVCYAAPVITSFSPASGPVGTLVTVTGTNLGTPTKFTIAGANAIVVSNTGTALVVMVMPGAVTGTVAITTASGTATSTSNFVITARPAYNMVQNGSVLAGSQAYSTNLGRSVALSADGKTAVVSGESNNPSYTGNDVSAAFVFTFTNDTWSLQTVLQGAGELQNLYGSGGSVAISADGNTVLLGVPFDQNTAAGDTYVFIRSGNTWTQQGGALFGANAVGAANEGYSVALSADGNTAVIGASNDNSYVGASWVFSRSAGVWTQQGDKLVGTGYTGQSFQGSGVAISADGSTLITGGRGDNNYVGAAWVFSRSGSSWVQQGGKLTGSDAVVTGNFLNQGSSIALSADGNTALVGGAGDNNSKGAAWVYARSGGTWSQQGSKLTANTGTVYPTMGSSVALSADGNLALIGANGDNNTVNGATIIGAMFEFTRSGTTWTQFGSKLIGTGGGNGRDQQGTSVALTPDGVTVMSGAPEYLNNLGASYVFTTTSPSAATLPATAITTTTATLNGTVDENVAAGYSGAANYNLLATTVTMVYSTSPTLATKTTATLTTGTSPMPGGAVKTTFASALTGLSPGTTYYFMISGSNSFGSASGGILSFTTTTAPLQPQTITFAAPPPVTYGSADVAPGATSTNSTIPITYTSSNPAVAIIVAGKIHIVGVGSTTITASQAANTTYSAATPVLQNFVVNPTPLTITADNQTRMYGAANPVLTVTYKGFVNQESPQNLGTPPTVVTTATLTSAVGPYPITVSGAVAANYNISYNPGTLTITPAAPATTTQAATAISTNGVTLNGLVNDDGAATTVQFQYGTVQDLSTSTTVAVSTGTSPIPAGTGQTSFTAVLTGLTPGTTYYFRIFGTNNIGAANGTILSFTTGALLPQKITFAEQDVVVYGSADIAPGATSTNPAIPITYTSSNPAVANITASGLVHNVSAGRTIITALQVGNSTYSAAFPVNQNFVVNPAPLVIIPISVSKTAGQPNPVLTATYQTFVNGDTQASLTTQPTITTTATTSSPAGTYTITAVGAVDPNYNITYATGTLTVTNIPLTFNPIPTKTYGDPDFDPGAVGQNIFYSSGDTSKAVIVNGKIHIKRVGSVTITATISEGSISQTLVINPAPLNIIAVSQAKVYGSVNPVLTITYNSFVNGDTQANLTSKAVVITTAVTGSPAGSYPITVSGAADANYTITYSPGTLAVSPAPLLITADNKTKTVGTANPQLTVSYTGFVGGDSPQNLSAQPTITTTATAGSIVGSYPIAVSGASDPNYTITYKSGTLTITPPLNFGPIAAKTYGDPDFSPGATGNYVTYTSGNTAVATITDGGGIHITGTGTSVITARITGASVQQTLTVNKAPLIISANSQTRTYGTANPALTLSYNKFVYSEDASVLNTQAMVTTTALTTSNVGSYPITVTGAAAQNYSITYANGTLTITPATRILTFNALASVPYGTADFDPGATVSSNEAISYSSDNTEVATIVNGKIHIISVGTANITATVPENSNYSNTPSQSQQLTVTQAPQTITFAAIPSQLTGATYDLSSVTASSGLPVVFTLSDQTVASLNGTTLSSNQLGTETVTASQPGNANYLPAPSVSQTFNITDSKGDDVLVSFVVSPNGDGINDVLVVQGIEKYPDNRMILINRNGVKVYEASGYNNTTKVFDGHSSITGDFQQQGTLLYLLTYRVNGVTKTRKGFTELRY